MQTGFLKLMTQPLAGLTLFTCIVTSGLPSVAQLPNFPGGAAGQQTAYILGGGDRTQDLTLRDGNTIFIPTATNASLPQSQLAIVSSAADPNPVAIAVVGEVKRPGSSILIGTTDTGIISGLPTVKEAIQQAQGIKPLADIRRLINSGTEQILKVNLWQLLQTGDISQDAILQEGDTVVVPKATELPVAETVELATARFSPDTSNVSVVGEVETPGTIITPNRTLNQALSTAGGFKGSRARRSTVDLIRLNLDGMVSKQAVPVNLAQSVNDQSNPILRENDIIVVSRGTTRIVDTLGLLFNPAASVLTVLQLLGIR